MRQIKFLAKEIAGHSDKVELLVSNNHADDDTDEYARELLKSVPFRYDVNEENVGSVRNIAYLIENASGDYIWIVG